MPFNRELAEQICIKMGINAHSGKKGMTIGGKELPNDFSFEKLFRDEYHFDYDESFTATVVPVDMHQELWQEYSCDNQETALAA